MKFYLGSAVLAIALLGACSDDNSSSPAPESSSAQLPESSAEIESSESSTDTVWNRAALTWYTSWPEPGSEECEDYNGCTWAGWFAGLEDQQTEEWVSEHNIIAVHEKDGTMRMSIDGQPPLTTQHTKSVTLGQADKLVFGGDGNSFRLHGTVSAFECGLGYPKELPRPPSLDEIFHP